MSYIRTLSKMDIPAIELHFDNLSHSDRCSRFGGSISIRLVKKYISELFDKNTKIFGIFNDNSTILLGMVELHIDNKSAELAISVDSKFRGKGLGNKLFDYAIDYCIFSGIEKLNIIANRDNMWIKNKIKKLNMKNKTTYDQVEAEYQVPKFNIFYIIDKLHRKIFDIYKVNYKLFT